MMSRNKELTVFSLIVVSTLFLASHLNASAQLVTARTAVDMASPEFQATRDVSLAYQLASYGRRARVPEALVTAARILLDTPMRPMQVEKQGGDSSSTGQVAAPTLGPATLLAEAESMTDEPAVRNLIQQLRKRLTVKTRGGSRGAMVHMDRISPGNRDVFNKSFSGGETAIVRVTGDGNTNLDIHVYDENGKPIGEDTSPTDACIVVWKPQRTGKFRIEISNLGEEPNTYVLTTN